MLAVTGLFAGQYRFLALSKIPLHSAGFDEHYQIRLVTTTLRIQSVLGHKLLYIHRHRLISNANDLWICLHRESEGGPSKGRSCRTVSPIPYRLVALWASDHEKHFK